MGKSSKQSQHGNWKKITSNEGGYSRSTKRDKSKVHFATQRDMCHVKNAESVPKTQRHKGRVVLCGGIVKMTLEATLCSLNKARLRLQ